MMLWLLLVLSGRSCLSQHAWYNFNTTQKNFHNFSSYLQWTQADRGDVYLATQFYTGCSNGYFGGQLHSDGTHSILFSMWDFNATAQTAHGVSPWCLRFGGEGTGANCGLEYVFEFGVEYRFSLTKSIESSGVSWSAVVTKIGDGIETPTFLGTIKILSEGLPGDCTLLKPFSVSFQEYYLGGTFYSAANWRGPYLDQDGHNASSGLAAYDALSDCGNVSYPSNVSSSVPQGPSGRPNAFFQQGGATQHGCEKSMWQHSRSLAFQTLPLYTKPTTIGATSPSSADETDVLSV